MKNIVFTSAFFLLFSLLITSCSVDKRLYRKGYAIEWNATKKNDASLSVKENTHQIPDIGICEQDPGMKKNVVAVKPETINNEKEKITGSLNSNGIFKKSLAQKNEPLALTNIPQTKKEEFRSGFKKALQPLQDDHPKILPLALASFVLGLISLFAYYGAFVLGLLAIIFALIAFRWIRQNPGAYRGHGFALAGLICGIVSIAIVTSILVF